MPDRRPSEYRAPYTAHFIFNRFEMTEGFEDFNIAKEWACIRMEGVGENKEKYVRVKVLFRGAVLWELPKRKEEKQRIPFPNVPTVY